MGKNFFFLEKTVFFRAKNKTVIRRGPNPTLSLLLSGQLPSPFYDVLLNKTCHYRICLVFYLISINATRLIEEIIHFFWPRFYIVVLGIALFSGRIYFFHILFGLLFSFSICTFISLFSLDFYFPFFFGLLFSHSLWIFISPFS